MFLFRQAIHIGKCGTLIITLFVDELFPIIAFFHNLHIPIGVKAVFAGRGYGQIKVSDSTGRMAFVRRALIRALRSRMHSFSACVLVIRE